MLNIPTLDLKEEFNDSNLSSLITELNKNIERYNNSDVQHSLPNSEERGRCYGILSDDYYWHHLKKSKLFKSNLYGLNEIQAKQTDYQLAISGDKEKEEQLKELTDQEAKEKLSLEQNIKNILYNPITALPNNSKKSLIKKKVIEDKQDLEILNKLNEKQSEFKTLVKEHESNNAMMSEKFLSQQLSELRLIEEKYQEIITYIRRNKKKLALDKDKLSLVINNLKDNRSKIIDHWIMNANAMLFLMQQIGFYGHTDKLHRFLNELRNNYPQAAVTPNFPINNSFQSEDIQKTLTNFAEMFAKTKSFSKKQRNRMTALNKEFVKVPWINWEIKTLKNNKSYFNSETPEVAGLVTEASILNALNRGDRIIQELTRNDKKTNIYPKSEKKVQQNQTLENLLPNNSPLNISDTESIRINSAKIEKNDLGINKSASYFQALEINYQATEAYTQLTKKMGWDNWFYKAIDILFSPRTYISYQAVEKVLQKQFKKLTSYQKESLPTAIEEEVNAVFNKVNNLEEAASYFVEMGKQWDLIRTNAPEINEFHLQVEDWLKHYRPVIIRKLIAAIIEGKVITINNLGLLCAPKGFIKPGDMEHLNNLMKYVKNWKIVAEQDRKRINVFLNIYADELMVGNQMVTMDIEAIQAYRVNLSLEEIINKKHYNERLIEKDKIELYLAFGKEKLLQWVSNNLQICKEIVVKNLKIHELVNYAKFIQTSLAVSEYFTNQVDKLVLINIKEQICQEIILQIEGSKDFTTFKEYYDIFEILSEKIEEIKSDTEPKIITNDDKSKVSLSISREDLGIITNNNPKLKLAIKYFKLITEHCLLDNNFFVQRKANFETYNSQESLANHNFFGGFQSIIEQIYFKTMDSFAIKAFLSKNIEHPHQINFMISIIKDHMSHWPNEHKERIRMNLYCFLSEMILYEQQSLNKRFILHKENSDYLEAILPELLIEHVIYKEWVIDSTDLIANFKNFDIKIDIPKEKRLAESLLAAYQAQISKIKTNYNDNVAWDIIKKLNAFLTEVKNYNLLSDFKRPDVPESPEVISPIFFKKEQRTNYIEKIKKINDPYLFIIETRNFLNHLISTMKFLKHSSLNQLEDLFNTLNSFELGNTVNSKIAIVTNSITSIQDALSKNRNDRNDKLTYHEKMIVKVINEIADDINDISENTTATIQNRVILSI